MRNIFKKIAITFNEQGRLAQIIIINVSVFLLINISIHILHLPNIYKLFAVPIPNYEFIYKPWTIFTYMFTHLDLFHLISNMFLFYFVGQIYFLIFGSKKLLYLYVMSGLAGILLLLILATIFPTAFIGNPFAFGASASVIGVLVMMALYTPDYLVTLFFGLFTVKYKYFALAVFLLFTVIDFSVNMGGKITHLGGALFGLIYGYNLRKGKDLFNFSFFRKKNQLTVVSNTYNQSNNFNSFNKEARLNELLDKINKSGYNSLSKKDKEELHKLSQ